MTAPSPADRNLLFGILALQSGFITREQLLAAFAAWVVAKARPLGDLLQEQTGLTPERRRLLESLADEHLRQHGDDPKASLAAVGPDPAVRRELEAIADSELRASLYHVGLAGDTDPYTTTAPAHPGAEARFQVVRLHARGGLGEVYLAFDRELDRHVALKQLKERYADDTTARARFVREAKITGALAHPNIVPTHSLGAFADGRPYYAMHFVSGESLDDAIRRVHGLADAPAPRRAGVFATPEFRRLVEALLAVGHAIAYAHSHGILHRDLKPANVMLGKYGETFVVDWGLAKPLDGPAPLPDVPALPPSGPSGSGETVPGSAVGTPYFMSPEQAVVGDEPLGPATDVYGLGATLYVILTGRPPYEFRTTEEVLKHVLLGDLGPPRGLRSDVPPALEAVCLKAMARKPADRYPGPAEFVADLRQWLDGEPVSAFREGLATRAGRWARKRKPLVTGVAAALLVGFLSASAAGVWYADHRAKAEADDAIRAAELERRKETVNREVLAALEEGEKLLDGLRARLDDPTKAHVLLSRIDEWRDIVERASQAEQRARAASAGQAELMEPETAGRLARFGERARGERETFAVAKELDDIRLQTAENVDGEFAPGRAGPKYAALFARVGLDVDGRPPEEIGGAVARSPLRPALVAALDHWAHTAGSPGATDAAWRPRLLAAARVADPDPWRDRFRRPEVWGDKQALRELAAGQEWQRHGPQLIEAVGLLLGGADGAAVLRGGLRAYPGDFWLHFDLALYLTGLKELPAAAAHYQAALAIRPTSGAAHNNLGWVLRDQKDLEGAVASYRKAIELDPAYVSAHNNLGIALAEQKDRAGAADSFRKAIELDPDFVKAHSNLGKTLLDQGDVAGAAESFRKTIALDPARAPAHADLGLSLLRLGRPGDALASLAKAGELGISADRAVERCRQVQRLAQGEGAEPRPAAALAAGVPGELADSDPLDLGSTTAKSRRKAFVARLAAGKPYVVELAGDFDVYLRVEDEHFNPLMENDDAGPPPDLNSRLVFTPEKDGLYRLVATSFERGKTGSFTLRLRATRPAGEPRVFQGELKPDDSRYEGKHAQSYPVELTAGRPAVLELSSPRVDVFLVLIDTDGKTILAENDDVNTYDARARIDFTPALSGRYTVIVTSLNPGETGPFTLRVQQYGLPRDTLNPFDGH